MAFLPANTPVPSATFDGFFQGASIDEIDDYFQKPPVSWQPPDLQLSVRVIKQIYQRHLSKHQTPAQARGHAAGLLVLAGHCPDTTQARRYVRAMFA